MEDLYNILKMTYPMVKVISRQAGMYLCSDGDLRSDTVLYINNEISPKGIDLVSMSFGKSWVAILYKNKHLEIINKRDGSVIYTFCNILEISKQNIYDDKCSTLSLLNDSGEHTLVIIDNKNANIINVYNNILDRRYDSRSQYELMLKMLDDKGKEIKVGINRHMKGVVIHET